MDRPYQIKALHLGRRAIVYLRQSTELQVRVNQGSTTHQRDQVRFPREWGWPQDAIEIVDEDLGRSGSSTVNRHGYRRMFEAVRAAEVGAIFSADFSRICRNLRDAVALVDECKVHDVLIVIDGRVHDLRDSRERLLATMVLNVAEFENDARREALYSGRLAKAKAGRAVSPPPAGYVAQDGSWLKDPDEAVRAAVSTVFRVFLEVRSLVKTVARLVEMGVNLPRRVGHLIRWVRPDIGKIGFMVNSRAYAGDYVFRKRRVDEALGRSPNGRLRDRPAREDEIVVVSDHHEPYVSHDQWNEMQHILQINAPRKDRRNMGPGGALLQGVLRCSAHPTRVMRTRHKRTKNEIPVYAYACEGDVAVGGKRCGAVPGLPLEHAVVAEIARRLHPPNIEMVREAWRQMRANAAADERRSEVEIERLRRHANDLRRRYMLVEPENRLVAASLESELEAATRELKRVEAAGPQPSPLDAFTEEAFADLVSLCGDFQALWNAQTTEPRDRKEIARTMLANATVQERTREQIRAKIRWADGGDDVEIVVRLGPFAYRRIAELFASGLSPREIEEKLNSEGLLTLKRNSWTRPTVEAALRSLKKRRIQERTPGSPTESL